MNKLAELRAAAEKAKKGLRIVDAKEYEVSADTILALVACAEALREHACVAKPEQGKSEIALTKCSCRAALAALETP